MIDPVRFRSLSLQRRRAWALSLASVVLAGALLVLLRAPAPASGAVPTGASVIPPLTTSGSATPRSRTDLDGPAVHGTFALATGAVLRGAPSELLAELRLTGLENGSGEHVPVSLAVVLDRSGSMSGENIVMARESIVSLLNEMNDDDRLAVIVYDDGAQVLQPLAPARVLRRSLPDRVRRIDAMGGTNIPEGLALGIDALREAPEGTARRIILISDGRDGSGRALSSIASDVARSADGRVITSSLGVGIDYDGAFMTALADAGHGNYAFLERGAMLEGFLRRELDETSTTVAESVVAEIALPAGVRLRATHGGTFDQIGDRVRIEIGALFAGERRKVVLEMESASAETPIALPVRLTYHAVAAAIEHGVAGEVVAAVVGTEAEVDAARDRELYPDAIAAVLAAQQDEALAAWRSGDRDAARHASEVALERYRHEASRRPSPRLSARIAEVEAEMDTFDATDPSSAAGRSFDLGTGASRREDVSSF